MTLQQNARGKLTLMSFLLPSLLGFLVFVFLPFVMAIALSFTNYTGGPNFRFVGFRNYQVAFADKVFRSSLSLTFKYMLVTVVWEIALGLLLAVILSKPFKGCAFFRGLLYIPNILSSIAVSLAFMYIFEPTGGIVNQVLRSLGLPTSQWLASQKAAMPVIEIVSVWQNFGYYMVLFIGGLQNVNTSLYEAAEMDGANAWQKFKTVTIPGLSPVLFYGITIAIIRAFKVFDYVFAMTGGQEGGGPAGSTTVLAFDIYRSAFMQFRFGYASAESVVLLIIVFIITMVQNYGQKKWVVYDVV